MNLLLKITCNIWILYTNQQLVFSINSKNIRKKKILNYRRIERIVKGAANHRRIQMLDLLMKEPELSVEEIAAFLRIDIKNVSQHMLRLVIAGLVMKRPPGRFVRHKLTRRGKRILTFYRMLEL